MIIILLFLFFFGVLFFFLTNNLFFKDRVIGLFSLILETEGSTEAIVSLYQRTQKNYLSVKTWIEEIFFFASSSSSDQKVVCFEAIEKVLDAFRIQRNYSGPLLYLSFDLFFLFISFDLIFVLCLID